MRGDVVSGETTRRWPRRGARRTCCVAAALLSTFALGANAEASALEHRDRAGDRVADAAVATCDAAPAAAVTPATTGVPHASDDRYTVLGAPLTATADAGLLANDTGGPLTVIRHGDPAHGRLSLNPNGSFTYTPEPGYRGTDSFTYAITDAVQLYAMNAPPLATPAGVSIPGDGYGSSLCRVPGASVEVYGLTDRGPNVYLPDGTVIEPIPTFQPSIGKFRLENGEATLERSIPLADPAGSPYSGRLNTQNAASDRVIDLDGTLLSTDSNGYDPEGLVALPDGTFWVSDEYGPFITHFDATGRQIGRLSPFDGSLPRELANRPSNRGMEGLAVTPDGSTLIGIMQSALKQPDLGSGDPMTIAIVRIVTYGLATGELHEYLYLLDDPATNQTAVSEIAALSDAAFVVDERDGKFLPGAYRKLWRIDLSGATDVGPTSTLAHASYDGARGGLLVDGRTLEALLIGQDTDAAAATLRAHGITPVSKTLALDVGGLLDALDPRGRFFGHDKLEGLSVDADGRRIMLSNDSDFGIDVANRAPPFQLRPKINPPTGRRDTGEILIIDTAHLPANVSSATVTVEVVGTPPAADASIATEAATPTQIR